MTSNEANRGAPRTRRSNACHATAPTHAALAKVRCIDNRSYLSERPDGAIVVQFSDDDTTDLTIGRLYEVISKENEFLRVCDDSGDDYLFPVEMFEQVGEHAGRGGSDGR